MFFCFCLVCRSLSFFLLLLLRRRCRCRFFPWHLRNSTRSFFLLARAFTFPPRSPFPFLPGSRPKVFRSMPQKNARTRANVDGTKSHERKCCRVATRSPSFFLFFNRACCLKFSKLLRRLFREEKTDKPSRFRSFTVTLGVFKAKASVDMR